MTNIYCRERGTSVLAASMWVVATSPVSLFGRITVNTCPLSFMLLCAKSQEWRFHLHFCLCFSGLPSGLELTVFLPVLQVLGLQMSATMPGLQMIRSWLKVSDQDLGF